MRLLTLFISILFIFGYTFTPSTLLGQDRQELSTQDMRDLMNTTQMPLRHATETTGTPYLYDSFHDGSIVLANGQTTNVIPIRYNAYEQTLEFRDGESAFVMDPNTIEEFEIYEDNSIHTFKKGYDSRRLSEDEFVRMIIDDEVKFMAKHTVSFQQGVATYGSATQQDEYLSDVTYYLKVGDGDVNRLRRLNERRVMRNIDHYEDEIEDFADHNNIDFSDPNDLEKLLLHYNSLLQD